MGIVLSRYAQAGLHLCCLHMADTGFLMTWLIFLWFFVVFGVAV